MPSVSGGEAEATRRSWREANDVRQQDRREPVAANLWILRADAHRRELRGKRLLQQCMIQIRRDFVIDFRQRRIPSDDFRDDWATDPRPRTVSPTDLRPDVDSCVRFRRIRGCFENDSQPRGRGILSRKMNRSNECTTALMGRSSVRPNRQGPDLIASVDVDDRIRASHRLAPPSGTTTAKTEWSDAGALKAKSSNFWSLDMTADIEKEGFNPSASNAATALEDGPSRNGSETWLRNERCLLSHHFLHDFRAAVRSVSRRSGTDPIPNLRALKALDR